MTRLADRIIAEGFRPIAGEREDMEEYRFACAEIRKNLPSVPIFVVDNVSNFIEDEEEEGREWNLEKGTYPNLAPPFDWWWMEYDVSHRDWGKKHGVRSVGALARAFDMKDKEDFAEAHDMLPVEATFKQEPRWIVQWQVVMEYVEEQEKVPITAAVMLMTLLDEHGDLTEDFAGTVYSIALTHTLEEEMKKKRKGFVFGAVTLMRPMWLALSLMHCRNVEIVEQHPPRHERRRAERNKEKPPVRYSTVNITPMRKVLATEGRSGEVGLRKALHICRGHFKHFDEKPLFGRVRGTFWWGSMVRGDARHGRNIHDYKVKP